jgi:hypothetical protein
MASNKSMCLGLTKPLKNEFQDTPGGKVCKADSIPPSSNNVMESGSLNLVEPSGSHTLVLGILYLYLLLLS